ncbi:MAG: helix-turn-helix domain-containing protein [Candidatus Bathyarchaeia archaeon]
MFRLTKNQTKALRLFSQGIKPSEIGKREGMHESSVYEAIRRGKLKIDYAVELLSFASDNGIIDETNLRRLKLMLSKT